MGPYVTIRYRRTFPFPLDQTYAWLTDYQDDDPSLTTRIVKQRPVLSRTADKVVMNGVIEAMGRRFDGRAEVTLHPPDRWVARLYTPKGTAGSVYEYRLEPVDGGRQSRLVVDYRFLAKRWKTRLLLTFGRRRVLKEIDVMWDGFAAAMARDLGPAGAMKTPAVSKA